MVFVYVVCILFYFIQILLGGRRPKAITDFFEILVSKPSGEVSP
jgi:hypothetical protein